MRTGKALVHKMSICLENLCVDVPAQELVIGFDNGGSVDHHG